MPTEEEIPALQIEVAADEAKFLEMLQPMSAEQSEGQRALAIKAAYASSAATGAAFKAGKQAAAARDRRAARGRRTGRQQHQTGRLRVAVP